jgi:hypothetical protein
MADLIKKGKDIQVAHRTWELHSFPALQDISKHSYTIKTATKLESPRYVILDFKQIEQVNLRKIIVNLISVTLTISEFT